MASKKPILTSDMPECKKYKSVVCYTDSNDFERKVIELLDKRGSPEYLAFLEKEASENTWQVRVEQMLEGLRS